MVILTVILWLIVALIYFVVARVFILYSIENTDYVDPDDDFIFTVLCVGFPIVFFYVLIRMGSDKICDRFDIDHD